jgi:hypothetical protein
LGNINIKDFFTVYEDFVPISDVVALASVGPAIDKLDKICKVLYEINSDEIVLNKFQEIIVRGEYLRLGCMYDKTLVFSERNCGIFGCDIIKSKTAYQPFKNESGTYYVDDFPLPKIFFNNQILIPHWDNFVSVAKPFVYKDYIYFEARRKINKAPKGWEIWKMNLNTMEKELVATQAGNPSIYCDNLFYTDFSKYNNGIFSTKVKRI